MFERFSNAARRSVVISNLEVHRLGGGVIGDVEFLLGIVAVEDGIAVAALIDLGLKLTLLRQQLEQEAQRPASKFTTPKMPQSREVKLAIESAIQVAQTMRHEVIGTHHMLLGLLAHPDFASAKVLAANGVSFDSAQRAVLQALDSGHAESYSPLTTEPGLKAINTIDEMQKYLREFVGRADLHAQHVNNIVLLLLGAIVLCKDPATEIVVKTYDGSPANILWCYLGGNRYAFAYNHDAEQIEVRDRTAPGAALNTFNNDMSLIEVHEALRALGNRKP